jgi:hypothetical protein
MIAMAETHQHDIESILREGRKLLPPSEFSRAANVKSMAEYEALCRRASRIPRDLGAHRN